MKMAVGLMEGSALMVIGVSNVIPQQEVACRGVAHRELHCFSLATIGCS